MLIIFYVKRIQSYYVVYMLFFHNFISKHAPSMIMQSVTVQIIIAEHRHNFGKYGTSKHWKLFFFSFPVVGSLAVDEAEGTSASKRKRKPSAKVLELQEERGRKPPTRTKPVGRPSRSRSKLGDEDVNGYDYEDDETDDY